MYTYIYICGIDDNHYANTDDFGLVAMQLRFLQPSMLRFAPPARGPFGDGKNMKKLSLCHQSTSLAAVGSTL